MTNNALDPKHKDEFTSMRNLPGWETPAEEIPSGSISFEKIGQAMIGQFKGRKELALEQKTEDGTPKMARWVQFWDGNRLVGISESFQLKKQQFEAEDFYFLCLSDTMHTSKGQADMKCYEIRHLGSFGEVVGVPLAVDTSGEMELTDAGLQKVNANLPTPQ